MGGEGYDKREREPKPNPEISFSFTMTLDKLWNGSHSGCTSYIFGDFQYLTRLVPEKPDLTLEAALLSKGPWTDCFPEVPSILNYSMIIIIL